MNNPRLLRAAVLAALTIVGGSVRAQQSVITLEEIFRVAESSSVQLRPAASAISEAEQEVRVAKAQRLPDINATLTFSFIGDGFTTKRNFADYQVAEIPHFGNGLNINVSQPVYTGGAITNAIELAELKTTAGRYAEDLTRDNLRFHLTASYLDLYKYHNLRSVVLQNIARAEQVLEQMKSRFQAGTALQNDITRYELLISNLNLQLIRIDNTLDILNNDLVITAGLPAGTRVVPDSTILERALPQTAEAGWQQTAATHSPQLQLARSEVDITRKAEALTASERLPKIALQAGWSLEGPILVEVPPINRNLSYWWVGVGVNYNLSSLFKTNKSIAKSKAATRTALDRLDATDEQLRLAIRENYIRYLEAYEALKTQQKSVQLAADNYAITSTRYEADMALITDMLDAANSQLDAEQQLVNARINIIYQYYKLLFVSGTI